MSSGPERPIHIYASRPGRQQVNGLAEQNGDVISIRFAGSGFPVLCRLLLLVSHPAMRYKPSGRFVAGLVTPKLFAACWTVA